MIRSDTLYHMKIILHGVNIELTPAIKSFAEEKIDSISRFFKGNIGNVVEARVELGKPSRHHKSGPFYYAEVNLKIGRRLLRASSKHSDLYVAIDKVRDEIEVQLKKFKEQIASSGRRVRVLK